MLKRERRKMPSVLGLSLLAFCNSNQWFVQKPHGELTKNDAQPIMIFEEQMKPKI